MNETIAERVEIIRLKIVAAAERAGRSGDEVALMAVTKFHPAEAVKAAYEAGVRLFGENRVQEAEAKYGADLLAALAGLSVDLIGQLQKNKVNKALALFDAVQSVDSMDLMEAIVARLGTRSRPLGIYFELRTGEESKSGFESLDELQRTVEFCLEKETTGRLRLLGLMTLAPLTGEVAEQRKAFRTLNRARTELKNRFGLTGFDRLSMGMSSDFETAIEEGSTLVRIGTAIFGERLP